MRVILLLLSCLAFAGCGGTADTSAGQSVADLRTSGSDACLRAADCPSAPRQPSGAALCEPCSDGQLGCAHPACVNHTCEIQYCAQPTGQPDAAVARDSATVWPGGCTTPPPPVESICRETCPTGTGPTCEKAICVQGVWVVDAPCTHATCTNSGECVHPDLCEHCTDGLGPSCDEGVCTEGLCSIVAACSRNEN